jgi:cytochrome c oxidase subunit 4
MSHSDAQHGHAEPNYFGIIIVLAILTATEIAVVFMPIPKFLTGLMLVVLALWKAAMVALYFMHLKFEKTTLGIIAVTPLVLCALLMFALLPDADPDTNLHRTSVPATAGHP